MWLGRTVGRRGDRRDRVPVVRRFCSSGAHCIVLVTRFVRGKDDNATVNGLGVSHVR